MADRRSSTIRLGDKDYAKVAVRLKLFLEDNQENISIITSCEWKEGWVIFHAEVTSPRGKFTGHSLGQIKERKAFEKQETIAVGRALAFAGYLASGEIASFEEMQDWQSQENVGASFAQHRDLKERWWATVRDSIDPNDAGPAFAEWVHEVAGVEGFAANDPTLWIPKDFAACHKALDDRGASALEQSGLKQNGGPKSKSHK